MSSRFAQTLERLGAPKRFAIAVSGGRDSIALANLCAGYAEHSGIEIHALTVDHGLRDGSGDEAQFARERCIALGLTHEILLWEGPKPKSGLQAAARQARYRLLIDAARARNITAIMTAHSADDVAETFMMRLARGASIRGLAMMRERQQIAVGAGEPITLLRPLLEQARSTLGAIADDAYLDDPSNEDPKFERVRMRAVIAALGANDILTSSAVAASASHLRTALEAAHRRENALFDQLGGCFFAWGGVSIDRLDDDLSFINLMARLFYAVGGGDHFPNLDSTADAVTVLRAGGRATLGGALAAWHQRRLWMMREPAALLGRAGVEPSQPVSINSPMLWDNRFVLTAKSQGVSVCPLGAIAPECPPIPGTPREAALTIPCELQDGQLKGAASHPFMRSGLAKAASLVRERFAGEIIRF